MSNFTDYLSAFSAAVSAAAAFWAWKTATEAHNLAKSLAEKAVADEFALELERLTLAVAEVEAESAKLYFLGANTKAAATSRATAMGSDNLSNSRFRLFIERVDEHIADSLEATDKVKGFRNRANEISLSSERQMDEARKLRIECAALGIEIRGKFDRLQVDRNGWVNG
jgi:hypothetical protein